MTVPGFRFFLGPALILAGMLPASAEDPALCGGRPVLARIIQAIDESSLKLEDGRVVHLASVMPPMPIDADRKALLHARAVLAELANGKEASLFLVSESKDRYGRISAQAIVFADKSWLEAELISRGIARVRPVANDKCMTALLQFEAKARTARIGFWSEPKFGVFNASQVEALLAAEGRFVVVEGTVRRVGESRGRIYLDFGRRFREDFTIVVPDTIRKLLVAQGSDPKSWRGKHIRVRGIIFSWGGPAIELSIAQAIERLD